MAKGEHRVTPNSKTGRRLTSGGGLEHDPRKISDEIRQWNAEVERKKLAKQNKTRISTTHLNNYLDRNRKG